jgi:alkylation response protein AidB-like acyl-CoA dehydrogenase
LADGKELYPGSLRAKGARTLADEVQAQETVAIAEAKLGAARAFAYATVEEVWDSLQRGQRLTTRTRAMYRIMMTYAHQTAKEVVTAIADVATTSAIYRGEPIERQVRDIHTACQHRMVHPKIYVPAGRILLGRDSGDPMI